jgi:hypothetical protein
MTMIDAHDQAQRVFDASLVGIDLNAAPKTTTPGRSSTGTTTGLYAFVTQNWNTGARLAEVEL